MSAAKDRPSLAFPPADPEELRGFPAIDLTPERSFFRVTRRDRGPWWFGGSLAGRFDLPHPRGTCYLAEDEIGAILEAVGPGRRDGAISARFVEARLLHRLRLPHAHHAADCTSRRSAGFGVTGEIGTLTPYELPQAWAAKLERAGFDGLAYRLRHDPSGNRGFGLFGAAGEQTDWPRGESEPISAELERRLHEQCGIAVLEVPSSEELQLGRS